MSIDWCPKDSDLLVSCGKDNRTIIWDTKTATALGDLYQSQNWSFETKWSVRNPDLCLVASYDGTVSFHSIQGLSGTDEQGSNDPSLVDSEKLHQNQQDLNESFSQFPNDPFLQFYFEII